jgi:hypothetical protein
MIEVRANSFVPGLTGHLHEHSSRAILLLEVVWGRLVRWGDDEETERAAAWDLGWV